MNGDRNIPGTANYVGADPDRYSGTKGDVHRPSLSERHEFMKRAKKELAARRRRIGLFGNSMFGEAAWEVLLTLYATENQRQTIGSLSKLVCTAPTTTLRWLDYLECQCLIRREPHPTDARAVLVELTDKAMAVLDVYFHETVKAES